jgi:hypothetical protein
MVSGGGVLALGAEVLSIGERHWLPIQTDDKLCRAAHELLLAYLNATVADSSWC